MTRVISYRYRIQVPADFVASNPQPHVEVHIYTLDEIERSPVLLNHSMLTVASRDESTGLQDSNAADIYEGDIIRFGHARRTFLPLEPPDTAGEVAYRYGGFNVVGNSLGEVTDWHNCVVIGNIHDNPDLLKS